MIAAAILLLAFPLGRAEFSRGIATIKPGDTQASVLNKLGRPDDILTMSDPKPHLDWDACAEIWCYGTNGHGSLPTLGHVQFDVRRRVQDSTGAYGSPPKIPENRLRTILRSLDRQWPRWGELSDIDTCDPLSALRIAIDLQKFSPQEILAGVLEYERISGRAGPNYSNIAGALGLLFQLPPTPKKSFHPVIFNDIPLSANWPGMMGGAVYLEGLVAECKAHGRFRSTPLQPRLSAELLHDAKFEEALALLLRTVYKAGDPRYLNYYEHVIDLFDAWLRRSPAIPVWDHHLRCFRMPGHAPLTESDPVPGPYVFWNPPKANCSFVAEWQAPLQLNVLVGVFGNHRVPPAVLRTADGKGEIVATIDSKGEFHPLWSALRTGGGNNSDEMLLAAPRAVPLRFEIQTGGEKLFGPVIPKLR